MNILPQISLEQQHIVDLLKQNNNVIVESVAGAGKTTTSIYIGKEFIESKILLLTYNAKLKIETRDKLKSLDINNIETHSYHSFCVKYYNSKAYTDTVIIQILDKQTINKKVIKYDIIILDELQDISPLYYKLVCKIFKDNINNAQICILGDRYQTIYDFKDADPRFIIHADKLFNYNNFQWSKCMLSQSYRITNEMAEFINNCLLKQERIKSNKIYNNKPHYIVCDTFDESTTNIPFIQVKKYLEMGYKPTEIFILAPSIKSELSPVRKLENLLKTQIQDIPIYVPTSDDEKLDSDVLANKLVFSTFHQAKGLERKVVIVYNFDDSYFRFFNKDKDPLCCPNEYYVATTRASEHLILVHHYGNAYFQFINIPNLKKYCNFSQYKKVSVKENKGQDTYKTSVTKLLKHLPEKVLNNCMQYLKITKVKDVEESIKIESKIKDNYGYENVSEISGTIIPAYYEYMTTGKMTILQESKNSLTINKHMSTHIDFIDDDIIKPTKIYDLNNIDVKNVDELLYLGNYYCSLRSGFKFKLYQITNYDWITKENLEFAYNRMKETLNVSKNAIYEGMCDGKNNPELLNRHLIGYIDCIDDNMIYEFKCVNKLETEHYLQLAIYMYLYETKIKEEKIKENTDEYKMKLNNYSNYIITNNTKIKNNKNNNLLNDKLEKDNKFYEIKINEINELLNKKNHTHIILNKYYLYNILSNEMQQIICNYNDLVSMIEYLIHAKYVTNKQYNDEIFITNMNNIKTSYLIKNDNTIKLVNEDNIILQPIMSGNTMVLDTETGNISNTKLAELGYIVYNKDNKIIKEYSSLIKPDYEINNTQFHGITTSMAIKHGKDLQDVLLTLYNDLLDVDAVIGHNISFDKKVLLIQCDIINCIKLKKLIEMKKFICTLAMARKIMAPPHKLNDVYKHFFKQDINKQHRALEDCKSCADCYYKMISQNSNL